MRILVLACCLCLTNVALAEEPSRQFTWTDKHRQALAAALVTWDGAETGAPCLDPEAEYPPDAVAALQVALLFGEMKPGTYAYGRPPDHVSSSFYVEKLPLESQFQLTERHLTILRHMSIGVSDESWEGTDVPGCDPKRPYGDLTFFELDMAHHLKLIDLKTVTDDDEPLTDEVEEDLSQLHHEMQPALQVFLQHFELPAGRQFVGDEWGNWKPK